MKIHVASREVAINFDIPAGGGGGFGDFMFELLKIKSSKKSPRLLVFY